MVLPIEPWWLRDGLSWLIEEVRAAARPVALVLLHRYNGLDLVRTVAGLLTFISEAEQEQIRSYVQEAAGSPSSADQLAKLADLRDRGVITAEEFDREKAKILA